MEQKLIRFIYNSRHIAARWLSNRRKNMKNLRGPEGGYNADGDLFYILVIMGRGRGLGLGLKRLDLIRSHKGDLVTRKGYGFHRMMHQSISKTATNCSCLHALGDRHPMTILWLIFFYFSIFFKLEGLNY